jgi:membrane protein YqaA with SNARE-associated domain
MRKFVSQMAALGPSGLFVLALADSAGIPLPGGVSALLILISSTRPELALQAAAFALVGSVLGCTILFYLMRMGGQHYLERATSGPRGRRFRRWFDRYGMITVFIPAMSPIPMPFKPFVAMSGVLGVNFSAFLSTVCLARGIHYFGLAILCRRLGANSGTWLKANYLPLSIGVAALTVIMFLAAHFLNKEESPVS